MEAGKQSTSKSSGMKGIFIVLGVVAAAGGGLIAMSMMKQGVPATQASAQIAPVLNSSDLMAKARGVTRGNTNAPVKLMVFSDYMCPWCGEYATTVANRIRTDFIDTGKVVEIYYDFPLGGSHVHSFLAGRAARCAEDQNRFWEYHDLLFSRQKEWSGERTPPTKMFIDYAKTVGLEKGKFASCLQSDMHADLVEYNRQLGEQAGVNSTPTVFINGQRSAAGLDYDRLKLEIEAASGAGR